MDGPRHHNHLLLVEPESLSPVCIAFPVKSSRFIGSMSVNVILCVLLVGPFDVPSPQGSLGDAYDAIAGILKDYHDDALNY